MKDKNKEGGRGKRERERRTRRQGEEKKRRICRGVTDKEEKGVKEGHDED